MGGTSGALISQLQFNVKLNNHCCFERLGTITSRLNSLQSHNPRRPILSLRTSRDSRSFVCFAVDDDLKEKWIELGGGFGIGSAVEETLDVAASSREEH